MSDIVGEDTDLGDFKGLEPIKDRPMSDGLMIATVALNMALKYHDIGTVQDGTLYQQYKLEGKNMIPLDLHMVFETAKQMEEYLITAPDRLAELCKASDDRRLRDRGPPVRFRPVHPAV